MILMMPTLLEKNDYSYSSSYSMVYLHVVQDLKVKQTRTGSIVSGTPIVSLMRNLPACDYTEISGILNGTCNYMLSSMEFDGVEFDEALKTAQKLGYAEANPDFDIGGGDARAKAIILTKMLKDPFPTDKIVLKVNKNTPR